MTDNLNGIRAMGESDMTPEWRAERDSLQSAISQAIAAVEEAKQAGKDVKDGFAINGDLLGQLAGGKSVALSASAPGVYLGVREGQAQEAGHVEAVEDGTDVFILRMPNFEPGHSPELGEHIVPGDTSYAVARTSFLQDGSCTETSYIINQNGMVRVRHESEQGAYDKKLTNALELRQANQWFAEHVAPQLTF